MCVWVGGGYECVVVGVCVLMCLCVGVLCVGVGRGVCMGVGVLCCTAHSK